MMAPAMVDAIGAAGAVLTTLCWVPQAIKIVRERDTRAISLPGTLLCVVGVLFWWLGRGTRAQTVKASADATQAD